MKLQRIALLLALVGLMATAAQTSDMNFGSTARSIALGGAGLALGDDAGTTAILNPAAPAVTGARFKFIVPGMDFHSTGASFGDLTSSIDLLGKADSAVELVQKFAKQPTTLNFSTITGFAGTFGVTIEAEANGIISPGTEAARWATAIGDFKSGTPYDVSKLTGISDNSHYQDILTAVSAGNLPAADTAFRAYLGDVSDNHVNASLAYGPGLALSSPVRTETGTWYLGVNARILQTDSRQWQILASSPSAIGTAITNPGGAGAAILGTADFDAIEISRARKTAFKADIGAIYKPVDSMFQYGIVINNFIQPRLGGIPGATDRPMVSVGVAGHPVSGMTFAADLINLNKVNGQKSQLRMGAEWRLGRWFAARAGYTGATFAWGIEALGLNLAFTDKAPGILSHVLNF